MRHGGLVLVAIAAVIGCGGATAETARVHRTGPDIGTPPGGNGNHVATADEITDADAGSDADAGVPVPGEILVTGRGFMPQPAIRSGTAGSVDPAAARDGSSLDPSCIGTFPSAPQHIIKLGGPMDLLRVLVDSDGNDLTLAVHTPDGVWHCNDDSGDPMNGLNPTVEIYSPMAGEIEVWVGTYSSYSAGAPYRLAVTEHPGYASDFLRH
jgi:hypothetical protein